MLTRLGHTRMKKSAIHLDRNRLVFDDSALMKQASDMKTYYPVLHRKRVSSRLYILMTTMLAVASVSCRANGVRRTGEWSAFVDGMFIGPNPDRVFPLFQRHDAIEKSGNLEIRVTPHARDGSVFLVTRVRNTGRVSAWFQTLDTSFWIAPDCIAGRIRVDRASGSDTKPYEEDGLAEILEEIPPESQRAFFIGAHWDNLKIPNKRTDAELRLLFVKKGSSTLPVVVRFLLGPSRISQYKPVSRGDSGKDAAGRDQILR